MNAIEKIEFRRDELKKANKDNYYMYTPSISAFNEAIDIMRPEYEAMRAVVDAARLTKRPYYTDALSKISKALDALDALEKDAKNK